MATQAIRQHTVAVSQERAAQPSGIRDFFSAIVDLAGVYFGGGVSLSMFDSDHREGISPNEKAMIDADLNSVWTN